MPHIPKKTRICTLVCILFSQAALFAENPPHWKLAPTPPMGWNSYDTYGSSVTEEELLANAAYVRDKLRPIGYQFVVVDFRWSDSTAANYDPNGIGGPLNSDSFGRLIPAPNRFPSAADGKGFKPLADKVHAMGLKFGIHVMRGIPRQSVTANTPIEKSKFRAADAADTHSTCSWCQDMFGVNPGTQAGQDYYDSIFRLYASWGVDYVKVDDLSSPYHQAEIEVIRLAIDRSGRPMVFSTSPGATPVDRAAHVASHANLWRISADFWDRWNDLNHAFGLAAAWQETGVGGPGRWPDGDMIPLGRIGIRALDGDRRTRFTRDEQVTLMSLLAIMPSPLMLGMSLPDNDEWTLGLISNKEMLAINQDPLGQPGKRLVQDGKTEIWMRDLARGAKAVALFNRGEADAIIPLESVTQALPGTWTVWNVWQGKESGELSAIKELAIPKHASALLKLTQRK